MVEFDFTNVKRAFEKASVEMQNICGEALDNALDVIQERAKTNLKGSGIHYSHEMLEGIQKSVAATSNEGKVYIRGNAYAGTQSHGQTYYKNLWLDAGTIPRYTKDGVSSGSRKNRAKKMEALYKKGTRKGYRGSLKATNFFQNAKQSIPQAENVIVNKVKDGVTKIINDN